MIDYYVLYRKSIENEIDLFIRFDDLLFTN